MSDDRAATAAAASSGRSTFGRHIYRALPEIERADAITERIRSAVALGLLRTGDRLPAEAELADSLGVAAATVRESLAALRDLGIVETRRGRSGGTFVVEAQPTAAEQLRRRLSALSIAEIRDLGDERAAVEAAVVRLAIDRGTDAEVARLERMAVLVTAAPLGRDADDDPDERAARRSRGDSRFHIELAVVSQSMRLVSAQIKLQAESGELIWAGLGRRGRDAEDASREHLDLVAAVRDGDAQLAEALTRRHVRRDVQALVDAKLSLSYPDAGPRGDDR